MRKLFGVLLGVAMVLSLLVTPALADKPVATDQNGNEVAWAASLNSCAKIQDGTITDKFGNVLVSGFDKWGYNYQAHLFNGYYANYSRPATLATEGDWLVMKWSDSWLANVDCNHDGKLDRGLVDGVVGGISLGWETNHVVGSYDSDSDGVNDAHYTDFVKIVWTGPGSPLWGQYTLIQEVYNDPVGGYHGLLTKLGTPGFGLNDQWTVLP